jgi:hypothetical protein
VSNDGLNNSDTTFYLSAANMLLNQALREIASRRMCGWLAEGLRKLMRKALVFVVMLEARTVGGRFAEESAEAIYMVGIASFCV